MCRNVSALTSSFDGGENLTPRRMRNVYVRPPFESVGIPAASSGRSCVPSGYASRPAQVARESCSSIGNTRETGSRLNSGREIATRSSSPAIGGSGVRPRAAATQTRPPWNAAVVGLAAARSASRRPESCAIRETVLAAVFAIQTPPLPVEIRSGSGPLGSARCTLRSSALSR